MAFCSAVTLCFASIFSLFSAALLAIAFSTDNWEVISVSRNKIQDIIENNPNDELYQRISEKFDSSPLYFTRSRGLFRECYPGDKTKAPKSTTADEEAIVKLYMSPVETWCRNIDYFIPDEEGKTKDFKTEVMTKIHMARAMIALFIVAFFFMFVSFTTGVVGCWRTSPSNITASAVLMLLACLLSAGGMGLWHGVQHYQFMKISEESDTELYITSWPDVLKRNYEYRYDWSYIVSWVGVGMTLLSSILFALAALCIKNDRETEDAMNLQYLMPVYHQKQQPYGPYGYAAYPGPAAYYGSQYGLGPNYQY